MQKHSCKFYSDWARIVLIIATLFSYLPVASLEAQQDPEVRIPFKIRIEKDGKSVTGPVHFKTVITDEELSATLWSNDSSSAGVSEPVTSVELLAKKGNVSLVLGSLDMDPLPASVLDSADRKYLILWIDAGSGFKKFKQIQLDQLSLRAVYAYRAGYCLDGDINNFTDQILPDKLTVFSNSNNSFTLGDGAGALSKEIVADIAGSSDPVIRFNTTLNQWEYSNDGTTFAALNTIAPGSVGTSQLGNDAVTSAKILDGTIVAADISADAIGPTELASTAVVAGSYNAASITVDADGRITAASANILNAGDITAIGDAASGDAFVAGSSNGSKLVYEGVTIDGNATELSFSGDPAANSTVSIPNITGTLVTTGDTGSVNSTMITDGTIAAVDISADAVGSTQIATDAVGSAEIAVDSVGSSELVSTAVTPGSYSFASVTVDADGRITAASSGVEAGDITAVGNVNSGAAFTEGDTTGSELVYEGGTNDTFETRLSFSGDPIADNILTLPNITGSIITSGDTGSVTSTIIADGSVTGTDIAGSTITASNIAGNTITAGEIAPDAVDSSEIATDAVGSAEIAADSVGSSEITSTAVTPGSYSFASITVDADGRITAASSGVEAGDITAVGNVTSGPAFTEGDTAGSEFVYEGLTDDGFETRLSFGADPLADNTVIVPNTSGTIITSGDSGTVTSTMIVDGTILGTDISGNTITAGEIAADGVNSSEIATDAVGSSEIAADSVGSSELVSTAVTPGSYSFASVTVDADGRITAASSGVEAGDITAVGNVTSGSAFTEGDIAGSEFVYEGATNDAFETRLSFASDPAADNTVTIPNTTGTVITSGDTDSVTSTMILNGTVSGTDIAGATITASNIAANTITANEIAPDGVNSSEIATDAVGSAELAVDSVGSSELVSTAVTPGSYSFASITVDADGRLTAASSGAEAGDITAVGNVTSGPAFTEGDTAGSEIVYEGLTDDGFETRLSFGADPAADNIVTVPNTTGTIITSGDNGTVTSTMIADGTVTGIDIAGTTITASNIAANTITANEIAPDGVNSSEIAADSVGSSELASTAVTPGSYSFASVTVDADGRITAASSGVEAGDITAVGNVASGAAFTDGDTVGTELVYEGLTSDAFETRLSFTGNPVADNTVTIPNTTGTVVTSGDTDTVTSTMILNGTVTGTDIAGTTITASNIAANTITANEIAPDGVNSSEIASDAVGSAEIAADSVDSSELVSTAVTPGSYSLASITVDADGRITAASSGAESGDITAVGNVTSGAAFTEGDIAGSELVYEGGTNDAFETRLSFTGDPAADNTVTIPNTTGTVITSGDSGTVSSTMIADLTILDGDINGSAAIAFSKLASLTSGNILVGSVGNVATSVAMSGDATITSGGALAIADDSVDGTDLALGSDAQGDVMYYDGTDWARLGAGTSGQVLTTQGTGADPTWATLSTDIPQMVLSGRRSAWHIPTTTAATAFTGIGIANPAVAGTASSQPALLGATRYFIQWATAAAVNSNGGIQGPFTATRPAYRPKLSAIVRTDATITSTRIHVGLAEATLVAIATNTTGTTASGTDFISIAYDTGGTGNVTDWLCCSGDGTNYGCTTTGVAGAASTQYTLTLDWSTAGTLLCGVNGTEVSKVTNLSTGAVNLGIVSQIRNLIAGARIHQGARYFLEQN